MANAACRSVAALTCCAAAVLAQSAAADEVADFYRGKTVSLVVGHEVGTGFDVYGRVLARHLSRHIPGSPSVVVQNMVGASGMIAANWLYNVAPKDGTVVATFSPTVPTDPLLSSAAARFDPAQFSWIGSIAESASICGVSRASGLETGDLLTRDSVFGATGTSGPFAKFTFAVKNLLGARIKVVTGYKGSADTKIAIQRGEVQGICGLPFSTVTSFWRDDYESGAFKPILQLNGQKLSALGGIAHVDDYAKTAEDRQVFGLIFGVHGLGRLYVAPPAIPQARRNALRAAFTATLKDAQLLADAAQTKIDINPGSGEEVAAFLARIFASSPAVVERAKAALRHD
jgi:tripartite-type tricarboxylate transporter receptor subunit TctC